MRHHLEAGGLLDFERGMVGTVTRAPAGAEGHRYVLRLERREDANRFAQPFDPWLPFGREEFEGKRPRFARTHQATLSMGSIFAPVTCVAWTRNLVNGLSSLRSTDLFRC